MQGQGNGGVSDVHIVCNCCFLGQNRSRDFGRHYECLFSGPDFKLYLYRFDWSLHVALYDV